MLKHNILQDTALTQVNQNKKDLTKLKGTSLSTRSPTELYFWSRIGTPEYILNILTAGVLPPI